MTINLADNDPRVSYAVAASATQSSFTVSFEFFVDADLNVYVDGVLKTLTTDYTVTGGDGSTGSISMSVTGASGGSIVVITRDIDIERSTDFPSSGPFDITSLNEELDKLIAISADLKDASDRALQLTDYDTQVSLTLPDVNTRKGKLLAFNATTGAVEAGSSVAGATTVAALSTDIETLADIEDGTNATNAISDLAAIASDVSTVAGISSAVTGVNNISAAVTAVNNDASDIGTVSTNIASVNTVATNIADVITVANDLNEAISEIETAADDLNLVSSNIETVATDIANVNTVGSDLSGTNTIGTVAGAIANVNTAATNISGINTAASSISAINDFNDIFFAGSTAPSSPSAGDLWYDTANSKLKVYVAGSGFQEAGAYLEGLTTTHVFTATAAQTTFTTDDANNTMSIFANGNTLVFLNGVRLVEGSSSTNDYYVSGNNVVLNTGASAGDVIYVEVFTKISLTQETSLNNLVSQAQTSATNAATSETNAATSASNASTSETNAASSASSASTSATTATTQASASSTSASNAATSETNAASSATAAAASATQAAASAGGGTLKISSNDTTADVLENKLTAGTGVTLTKNNSGANETISVAVNPFSLTESNATATAAQTSFSVTYTAGLIQVFMNGVKLISGSDFTATNGTTVVLASGAAAGDVLEFVVFGQEQKMTKARQMADLIDNNGDVVASALDNVAAFPSGWSASLDGSDMVFIYNSTEVFKITTAGAVIAADDVTAFGTP